MLPWSFRVFTNYKNSIVPLFHQSLVMFPSPHPNLREALNNQWGRFDITD